VAAGHGGYGGGRQEANLTWASRAWLQQAAGITAPPVDGPSGLVDGHLLLFI